MTSALRAVPDDPHDDSRDSRDSGPPTEAWPPQPEDLTAEQAVLGACMLTPRALDDVIPILGEDPAVFYRPAHGVIWQQIIALRAVGAPTDPIAVAGELHRSGNSQRSGGAPYLHTLVSSLPTSANATWYATQLAELAVRRKLVAAGMRLIQVAGGPDGYGLEAAEIASRCRAAVDLAAAGTHGAQQGVTASDAWTGVLDRAAGETVAAEPLPTGLTDIDELLDGGLRPGTLTVVGARPSIGKSTLLGEIARRTALPRVRGGDPTGKVVLVVSLEMPAAEVMDRIAAAHARVHYSKIRTGTASEDELGRLVIGAGDADAARLIVHDDSSATIAKIAGWARAARAEHGRLDAILVDYVQLVTPPRLGRDANREQAVSAIYRGLKLLGKELMTVVVAAAQIGRGSEKRADTRPLLSDLRESGAGEQDADNVILMHVPAETGSEMELNLAKHRAGAKGMRLVAHRPWLMRIDDLAVVAAEG